VNEYFLGAIDQQIERGTQLLSLIDSSKPEPEFYLLAHRCREMVKSAIAELEELKNDDLMLLPQNQSIRLRRFRSITENLGILETSGVVALTRRDAEDRFLNRLLVNIRDEIDYPLLPPVVTGLSTDYFYIMQGLNLMFVPMNEGSFLLHLPDLYHELAHPLLWNWHEDQAESPQVRSYRDSIRQAFIFVAMHFEQELTIERRNDSSPDEFYFYLLLWKKSWWKWIVEFYCDLFATYTLGPAFAWAHIHLSMKLGGDPFHVPISGTTSHPADDARMYVMNHALTLLGYPQGDVDQLQMRWKEYTRLVGAVPEREYDRCYPQSLLNQITEMALEAVKQAGCRLATPGTNGKVHSTLNQAWEVFWNNPTSYIDWEKQQIKLLRQTFGELETAK